MQDFAQDFAAFSSGLDVGQLPAEVVAAVKTNLSDTLACAVAGWSAPAIPELTSLVQEWGGRPQATIWCSGLRVPAHHAALVNGAMAHARDYDDTHDAAVLHCGVSVVPAAIAAAELDPGSSGADLIAGVAAGLELICRLGVATRISIVESGFIYTSLFGHFAATVAAARVLRLDRDATVNALGVALSQAAGTHQVTRDAALTKRIQPGFAAKSALTAVALTRRGISGARQTFEGEDGLFASYLRGRYDPEALRDELGSRYELLNLSYKPYPCCRLTHTAIDAALAIRPALDVPVDEIDSVTCGVNQLTFEAVCLPDAVRRAPTSIVQAQFSIPYTIACALRLGRVGLSEFTATSIRDSGVLSLAARVRPYVSEAIEREWARNVSPADLTVATRSGQRQVRVDLPRGHPKFPLTSSDREAKLVDCLAASGLAWPADTAARLGGLCDGLESLPVASSIVAPLAR